MKNMRLVCMWCNMHFEDSANIVNNSSLYGVCPKCHKRIRAANKKFTKDSKRRDKRRKR